MRRTLNKNLIVGSRYWLREKGCSYFETTRPLIFIGHDVHYTPWFTFAYYIEDSSSYFNFIASPSKYNFYDEEVVKCPST